MPLIIVETIIRASREQCFDAARDITLHCRSVAGTRERAVAGVMNGLIGAGESVTFEGVHFGVRQWLTAKVVEFDRPGRLVDEMTQGAFRSLRHVHEFLEHGRETLMRDTVEWVSPLGVLGRVADALLLKRHMRRLMAMRGQYIKEALERQ